MPAGCKDLSLRGALVVTLWEGHANREVKEGDSLVTANLAARVWRGRPSYSLWASGMLLINCNLGNGLLGYEEDDLWSGWVEEGSDTEVDVEAAAPLKDPRSDAWNLTETFLQDSSISACPLPRLQKERMVFQPSSLGAEHVSFRVGTSHGMIHQVLGNSQEF